MYDKLCILTLYFIAGDITTVDLEKNKFNVIGRYIAFWKYFLVF